MVHVSFGLATAVRKVQLRSETMRETFELSAGGAETLSSAGQHYEQPSRPSGDAGTPSDEFGKFVSRILGSADVQWRQLFEEGDVR